MTDFVLEVRSFEGVAPGASHLRAMVKGPHPRSCHGGTTFHGSTGKTTCAEEHELPARVEWQVEEPWTESRYKRWAAREFEGDGPAQFKDEKALLAAARARFLGEAPPQWWDEKATPGQPGDRLHYECPPEHALPPEELREIDRMADAGRRAQGLPVHGDLIAEVPQPKDGA